MIARLSEVLFDRVAIGLSFARRWVAGLFCMVILFSSAVAQSESGTGNSPFLPSEDRSAIRQMLIEDFKAAAKLRSQEGNLRKDYTDQFGDIVDKYGLLKFEHFMSMDFPMLRSEAAAQGTNCADVSEFGRTHFDTVNWLFKLVFGETKLMFCFEYFETSNPKLSVRVHEPQGWGI